MGQPNQLASAPLSYSQTNVFCGYSFCHIVLSAIQDKAGPESPSREPSLPKGNRSIDKQLTSPCVRLLFSSIIDPTASYPGAMRMAPYPCMAQLPGAPPHRPTAEQILPGVVQHGSPFLLDQMNKHHTPLSFERDNNMSSLPSSHYTLEISSSKVCK